MIDTFAKSRKSIDNADYMAAATIDDDVDEFIAYVCRKVEGIGKAIAGAISADFNSDLVEFLEADLVRFQAIRRSNNKPYLTDDAINRIIDVREPFLGFDDVRHAWSFLIGQEFLVAVVKRLDELHLDHLEINPFLAIALELNSPEQVLRFNLYQSVTRSVVTSWGTVVEALLVHSGAEKIRIFGGGRSGRRPDIKKERDGTEYHLQIKSGPNTMNVDMVGSFGEVIQDYQTNQPDVKILLGMTYGTREMISQQISRGVPDFAAATLIGRELWEFVSEESDYHLKVFELLDKASAGVLKEPFTSLIETKLCMLLVQWKEKFGDRDLHDVLNHYV